jgi:hypothetical protein
MVLLLRQSIVAIPIGLFQPVNVGGGILLLL